MECDVMINDDDDDDDDGDTRAEGGSARWLTWLQGLNINLVFTTFIVVFGSSFQFGYNIGVLNQVNSVSQSASSLAARSSLCHASQQLTSYRPRGRRDDIVPLPPKAVRLAADTGSTSVRGRVRSPYMAKLQAASVPIA